LEPATDGNKSQTATADEKRESRRWKMADMGGYAA
jgi:hypothetical protein